MFDQDGIVQLHFPAVEAASKRTKIGVIIALICMMISLCCEWRIDFTMALLLGNLHFKIIKNLAMLLLGNARRGCSPFSCGYY